MPVHASTEILMLSNTQARELAGRVVTIGGVSYSFQSYDENQPGQPPWRTGAEGKAYPLVGQDGSVAAYLKFFTRPTQKRLDRTAWLIGQQMHLWLPNLAAAPVLWTDTRRGLHGAKIDFQFAAYLAKAVPGETWQESKSGIADGGVRLFKDLRWRCVTDLLLSLAALERAELVHGDLSPNNVIIDLDAQPDDPALYLIDFDAFVAPAAGANQAITVAEGGTYGTDGYCPPDLATAASEGDGLVSPYSDRCGRDMLLLEFLLMGSGLPPDDPLADWNREQLQRQFAAWQARNDPELVRTLSHLDPATVFDLSESERPTSVDLAIGLGLSLPERRMLRRVTELTRPAHAMLGYRPTIAMTGGASRRPPIKPFYRQGNQIHSGRGSFDWENRMGMLIVLAIPIVTTLFFISLLIVTAHSTGPGTDVRQDAALSETEKSRGETKVGKQKEADSQTEKPGSKPQADSVQPRLAELSALRQWVLPALVTVYRENSRDTGFLIEGGLVVTAYHVAPQGQKATVVFHQDGERALVIEHDAFDAAMNIAVLRTDAKRERRPLRLASSPPTNGSQVAAFKPGGGELQGIVTGFGRGMISGESARSEMLLTTLNAAPGWSGGPVVNMEGEVVGINSRLDGSIFESNDLRVPARSAAVPVTVLEPLLAIVRLSEAIKSHPTSPIYRRVRAALYLSKGDFEKAIEDYKELIRLEPKNAEAYCGRGKAYAERSQYENAVDDYTKAIDLNQDSVEAYLGRAAAREKKADLDGAISDYRALIELLPKADADALEPRLIQIYKDRAKLRAGGREIDKAIADLSAVLDLWPNDLESREDRAKFYDATGERDQAIADYTEVIRLEPKKADLYRRRGIMLAAKGDHDKAITDFTDAIRLNPLNADAYCARGAVHGGRHNFKKAIADFTAAIRLDQWQGKAYFDRGSAYAAQGDEIKAREDFDRANDLGYRTGR